MESKRGALEWTIGRLMTIVLLVILLAIIFFGIGPRGLSPLIERAGGAIDNVLILLNIKDEGLGGTCFDKKVSDLSRGDQFLQDLGKQGSDVRLTVCESSVCNFTGDSDLEHYSFWKRVLRYDGYNFYSTVLSGDLEEARLHNELYNGVLDELDSISAEQYYNKLFTKQFILSGDGSGFNEPIYAVWQNGFWRVYNSDTLEGVLYEGEDDDKAIDTFVKVVWGGNDDNVRYRVVSNWKKYPIYPSIYLGNENLGSPISDLVGSKNGFFQTFVLGKQYHELDDAEEVQTLKKEFKEMKNSFEEESVLTSEEFDLFKSELDGKEFSVSGNTFVASLEQKNQKPVILLSSSQGASFELAFDARAKHFSTLRFLEGETLKEVPLRYAPLSLFEITESKELEQVPFEHQYRLPREYFDQAYTATIVSDFLGRKCA